MICLDLKRHLAKECDVAKKRCVCLTWLYEASLAFSCSILHSIILIFLLSLLIPCLWLFDCKILSLEPSITISCQFLTAFIRPTLICEVDSWVKEVTGTYEKLSLSLSFRLSVSFSMPHSLSLILLTLSLILALSLSLSLSLSVST